MTKEPRKKQFTPEEVMAIKAHQIMDTRRKPTPEQQKRIDEIFSWSLDLEHQAKRPPDRNNLALLSNEARLKLFAKWKAEEDLEKQKKTP